MSGESLVLKEGFLLSNPDESPVNSRSGSEIDTGGRPPIGEYLSKDYMDPSAKSVFQKLYNWFASKGPSWGNQLMNQSVSVTAQQYKDVPKVNGEVPEQLAKYLKLSGSINFCASNMFTQFSTYDETLYSPEMDALIGELNGKFQKRRRRRVVYPSILTIFRSRREFPSVQHPR